MYSLAFIGALKALCQHSPAAFSAWVRSNLRGVAGASAGSLVGLMLCAGLDPWRMQSVVAEYGLDGLMRGMLDMDPSTTMEVSALSSGADADALCRHVTREATGSPDCTFGQLFQATGRTFVVVVTNAATCCPEFWSHSTHPDTALWLALRCSTCVPGVFASPLVHGVPMMDGGVACNLPCHLFPARETLFLMVRDRRVGTVGPAAAAATRPRHAVTRVLKILLENAQTGPLRMLPGLVYKCIPVYPVVPLARWGPYAFDAPREDVVALIDAGEASVYGALARDVLLRVLPVLLALLLAPGADKVGHRGQGGQDGARL
jgi:predicted acylesterase/phospholipase RssA